MDAAVELPPVAGVAPLCAALAIPRATFYRRRQRQAAAEAPITGPVLVAAEGRHEAAPGPVIDVEAAASPTAAPARTQSPRALSDEERNLVLEIAPIPWTPDLCRQRTIAQVGFGLVRSLVAVV